MTQNIKKVWKWLCEQSEKKARSTNDVWMLDMVLGMNPNKLTNAQVELLNSYLEIPKGKMLNVEGKEAFLDG